MATSAAPLQPAFRLSEATGFTLKGEIALVILTILVMIFLVYPTAWIIVASFKTPETMFSATEFEFTFDNYVSLFGTGYARNIFNSLYLCIGAVLISTFVSSVAAYTFSRMRFRFKPLIFGSARIPGATFWSFGPTASTKLWPASSQCAW